MRIPNRFFPGFTVCPYKSRPARSTCEMIPHKVKSNENLNALASWKTRKIHGFVTIGPIGIT
jgi:hypothetical protein